MKKRIFALLLCIVMVAAMVYGCQSGGSSTTSNNSTASTAPKVDQTLDATLYCYSFDSRGMRTFASRGYAFLPAEVTEENPVKIEIPLSETSDYQYPEKRKDSLHYTDKNLPYPCFLTSLYHPLSDSCFHITVAVDFEKQYMAFLITGNIITGVTVAAADPTVTPETIYTHFQEFLEVAGAGDFVFDETPYFGR